MSDVVNTTYTYIMKKIRKVLGSIVVESIDTLYVFENKCFRFRTPSFKNSYLQFFREYFRNNYYSYLRIAFYYIYMVDTDNKH